MDIRQLEYFIECVIFRSMRKVAQIRFCSVPLISRQISSLEQELGISLFLRTSSGLQLTKNGVSFLAYALKARDDYYRMRDSFIPGLTNNGMCCKIVCSLFDDGYFYVSTLLNNLSLPSKESFFRIHFSPLDNLVPQVANGRVDAGIIAIGGINGYPGQFNSIRIGRNSYKLVVGYRHPLFGERCADVDEIMRKYTADDFFLPGTLEKYRNKHFTGVTMFRQLLDDYIYEYVHNSGIQGKWVQDVSDIENFNKEVIQGTKMAFTAGDLSTYYDPHLRAIPFSNNELSEDVVFFWRKNARNPGLSQLITSIQNTNFPLFWSGTSKP